MTADIHAEHADEPAVDPGSTIGIIGGGQLGRMLAMAAGRLGHPVIVLEPSDPCPAAQVANSHIVAAYDDPNALAELVDRCDVVTYEFENVPAPSAALIEERHRDGGPPLRPSARALEVSQDRLVEKQFLQQIGLSVAPFRAVDSQQDVVDAVEALGGRAILKTRRFGYDGKGQVRVDGAAPANAFEQLGSAPSIAEGFVDFDLEISVIVGRSLHGDIRTFAPAHNEHINGILSRSTVPAPVSEIVLDAARAAGRQLARELEYVGVLGLEMFVMSDGELVANEFAPRVHNSGHWTELACSVDQFEQHIRAITGESLGATGGRACVMDNLIGDDVDRVPALLEEGSWRVHLYGKEEVRPGRKMGHATKLL